MKLRRSLSEPEEPIELNLIPLIDVIMFLLIFFISTTSFMDQPGLSVDKPQAGGASQGENKSILFAVTSDGKINYDGKDIGIAGVRAEPQQHRREETAGAHAGDAAYQAGGQVEPGMGHPGKEQEEHADGKGPDGLAAAGWQGFGRTHRAGCQGDLTGRLPGGVPGCQGSFTAGRESG